MTFTLIMFLAPWCGHCQEFKKNVLQNQERVNAIKNMGVSLVTKTDQDAGKDENKKYKVQGFPAFRLVDESGKVVWKYDGFGSWKEFSEELEKSTSESSA